MKNNFFLILLLILIGSWQIRAQTGAKFAGSYTVDTLPKIGVNAGDTATVTDSTRGIWQFDGKKWIPKDNRRANALDFCNPATTDDCTAGLQAAIEALAKLHGGTLVFPAGYTFKFASPLDLVNHSSITFEGTVTKGHGGTINLLYTGSGANAAFNMLSSYELTFRKLHIVYDNPKFTGWLLQTGHNGAAGGDTQQFLIDNCVIRGTENAHNAAGLVDLNLSIIGKIVDSHFMYANVGIRGVTGKPNYAYLYDIGNNTFNYCETAIYNPDANWRIIGNTFEPSLKGETVGIDSDNSYYIRGVTIQANNFSDSSGANRPQLRLHKGLGVSVSNNWFTLPKNATAMDFTECQGLVVNGNRVESDGAATVGIQFGSGNLNYAVTVSGNSLNAATPIANETVVIGLTQLSNETGGSSLTNAITSGLTVRGNAGTNAIGIYPTSLTIGSVYKTVDFNYGGGIRMTNALAGYNDGSMIIQARGRDSAGDIVLKTGSGDALKVNAAGVILGANLAGTTGAFTGNVTFPTQTAGDNSTKAATTAFVQTAINSGGATGQANLDFPNISASSTAEMTIAVGGASPGDAVAVSPNGAPENGLIWSGYVASPGIVKIRLANVTVNSINPAARQWTVKVR